MQSMKYPPNPNEMQSRPPINLGSQGFGFFSEQKLFGGPSGIFCSSCHLVTNFQVGTDNKITPKLNLHEEQSVKVPQLRGIYQKVGINRTSTSPQITGFGLSHDGTFDTLFNFQQAPHAIVIT